MPINGMYKIYFLATLLFLLSCNKSENLFAPENIKIYYKSEAVENNIVLFDILTTNNGFAMFGVGSNTGNKFETNGQLYFAITDSAGSLLTEKFIDNSSGFPAGVVKTNDKFVVVWNLREGKFKAIEIGWDGNEIQSVNISINPLVMLNVKYISDVNYTLGGELQVLGVGAQILNEGNTTEVIRKSFVGTLNSNYILDLSGQYEYNPNVFGNYGTDELSLLSNLDLYFILNDNMIAAPSGDYIALHYIGDPEPLFASPNVWIFDFELLDNNNISMVYNKSELHDTYYSYNSISLNKTQSDINDVADAVPLSNIDTEEEVFIRHINHENITNIVFATSSSGQVSINVFKNGSNEPVNIIMGNTYRYSIAGVIWDENQKRFTIVGNTRMEYRFYRSFMMQISLEQILKQSKI